MSNDEVFFKWSPKYNVNIRVIDEQHRELVNILNRLCNAVTRREGNQAIAAILDALMSYTQTHFALEESLMQQAEFEDYEAHKLEHQKLIERFHELCTRHLYEETPIYFEITSFLKAWLKEHLQVEVRKYSAALRQGGFSIAAWEEEVGFAFIPAAKRQWWEFWKTA